MQTIRTAGHRHTARRAAGLGGALAAVALLVLPVPAAAAPTGTVACTGAGEHPCYVDGGSFGGNTPIVTGLVPVLVGDATVLTYRTGTDAVTTAGSYEQQGWNTAEAWPSATVHRRRAEINWILHNSYPAVPAGTLDDHFGGLGTLRNISAANAVAATQAAIWHFTGALDTATFRDARARNLYQDLTIGTGNTTSAPDPRVSFEPATLSGTSGADAGPVTVHTTAASVTVALPTGITLLDGSGRPTTTVQDGQRLTVRLPAGNGGNATLTAVGTTPDAQQGRILASTGTDQWLLTVGPDTATGRGTLALSWSASATTGPSPTASAPTGPGPSSTSTSAGGPSAAPSGTAGGGLPVTGTNLALIGGLGAALLAAGAATVLLVRRRT